MVLMLVYKYISSSWKMKNTVLFNTLFCLTHCFVLSCGLEAVDSVSWWTHLSDQLEKKGVGGGGFNGWIILGVTS